MKHHLVLVLAVFIPVLIGCDEEAENNQSAEQEHQETLPPVSASESWKLFIPGDSQFVLVVHPQRVVTNSEYRKVELAETQARIVDRHFEMPGGWGMINPSWFQLLGKEFEDLELGVYVLHEQNIPTLPSNPEGELDENSLRQRALGPLLDAYLLKFTSPIHPSLVKGLLHQAEEGKFAGHTYWGNGHSAGTLVDPQTLILGKEAVVLKMLVASEAKPGPLSAQIRSLPAATDLTLLLNGKLLSTWGMEGVAYKTLMQAEPEWLNLNLKLLSPGSIHLEVSAKDAENAAELEQAARSGRTFARNSLRLWHPAPTDPQEYQTQFPKLQDLAFEMLDRMEIQRDENRVRGSIANINQAGNKIGFLLSLMNYEDQIPPWPKSVLKQAKLSESELEIFSRIPSAAGFSALEWMKLRFSPVLPVWENQENQSLSLGLLLQVWKESEQQELTPEARKEFSVSKLEETEPALFDVFAPRSMWLGFATLFQPEMITEFTCDIEGQFAMGTVEVQLPGYAHARCNYTARRGASGWEIIEFRFPNRGWTFEREPNGYWASSGIDSPTLAFPEPSQAVSGSVTFQGKPIPMVKIRFIGGEPPFVEIMTGEDGKFATELEPGKYNIELEGQFLPPRYGSEKSSGLRIEVLEGPNEFSFNLTD